MNNKNIIVVQNLIRSLDHKTLQNPNVVINLIRAFGIVQWGPAVFGEDEVFKNANENMAGIYQTPAQLANALIYLSDFEINTYLEIGVFQGGNFLFVSEYLRRFNPKIQCLGIDPTWYLNDEIRNIIEAEMFMSFKSVTSDQIAGTKYDLVFIDGEHTEDWVKRDYENVGQYAKICMIHDINEMSCPGVVAFWNTIKGKSYKECLDHTSDNPSQGIGIIKGAKS